MTEQLQNSAFLKACRGEATDFTPIWLNRQAGRYMKEYHEVKGDTPSLEFFKSPQLAAKVTIDAQRILGVDAAIMFADLLPMLEPMGLHLDYLPGIGPVIDNPVRTLEDIEALDVEVNPEGGNTRAAETSMPYIGEVIALIRQELPANIPLIGFAGAPFTLASYAIEGKSSKNYAFVKQLMFGDAPAWTALMEKFVIAVSDYVEYQIDSGVQAVQLFDSWVGCLGPSDYQQFVLPFTRTVIDKVKGRVPIIHFGTGNPALLDLMQQAGADVLALDWRAPLAATWDRVGCVAIQGNMDPLGLCSDRDCVYRKAGEVLDGVDGRPGHIFNLGHGIIPDTPVDNVKALVDFVHERSAR